MQINIFISIQTNMTRSMMSTPHPDVKLIAKIFSETTPTQNVVIANASSGIFRKREVALKNIPSNI